MVTSLTTLNLLTVHPVIGTIHFKLCVPSSAFVIFWGFLDTFIEIQCYICCHLIISYTSNLPALNLHHWHHCHREWFLCTIYHLHNKLWVLLIGSLPKLNQAIHVGSFNWVLIFTQTIKFRLTIISTIQDMWLNCPYNSYLWLLFQAIQSLTSLSPYKFVNWSTNYKPFLERIKYLI